MTGDPARRWPDDSPAEDAEADRAADRDRLDQWAREQKTRPLADALAEHGLLPGDAAESWCSPPILPGWWDTVPAPPNPCPWCQRDVPAAPCPECRAAREHGGDPAALWAWWLGLDPARRRVYLAAKWRTDPWTGRPVRIEVEWTDVDADGGAIATARLPFVPIVPSTAWSLGARAG
jgi:hypothetical protein